MRIKTFTRLLSMLLALLFVSMLMVPVVSAENETIFNQKTIDEQMIQVDPKTDVDGFVPVDIISIDPLVKSSTPYYHILILSESGKKNLLKSLELDLDKNEFDEITDFLNQLWAKYNVAFETKTGDQGYPTYGGDITYIHFSENAKGLKLSDEENKELESIQSLINENYKESLITPKWSGSTHGRISYWAAYKCLFPYPSTVESAAGEPDTWYEWAPYPFNQLFQSLSHYYNPSTGIGGAPQSTRDHLNAATSYYSLGSAYYSNAATKLGHSSHFLEDVGNPMHTGGEGTQVLNQWIHTNYEGHVTSNWNSQFESVVSNNYNYYWYTDWEQGTRDLAGYSNGYLDALIQRVYDLGSSWDCSQPDSTIDSISRNCILRTAKYVYGMAIYAKS